jgi:TatD DNase family protein
MVALIDTHCHLDLDVFEADRNEVIERAWTAGVEQMLVIGFDQDRWKSGSELCRRYAGLHLAVGLHPTEAERYNEELESALRQTARDQGAVAIGETGLDYHWKSETAEQQKDAFARQITLAKEMDLPFVVHQRDAERDTLDVLKASSPPHRGVMHCFTGGTEFMLQCLDLGMHIGFGGAVTFRKLKELHQAASEVPIDRMLLETDAPFMAPSPHRGKRNEPSYVQFVADRLGELRGVTPEEIAENTRCNAVNLFRLPVSVDRSDRSS